MKWAKQTNGFTIVELLIVIVVIGILAAITIVAFNGVQDKAKRASLQADVSSAVKTLEQYRLTVGSTEQYPATQALASLKMSSGNAQAYTYKSSDNSYCLTVTNGATSYYTTSHTKTSREGTCGADSLIGSWSFNGNANDESGNGLDGTVVGGATLTTGQNGVANSAYALNGTSQYVLLGSSAQLNTKELTYSAWVKTNNPAATQNIFAKELQYKYRFNAGGIGILISANGNGWTKNTTAPYAFAANVWYHIVFTLSSSGNTANLYVNGALVTATDLAAQPITTFNTTPTYIGSHSSAGDFLSGVMDDARMYSRSLSAAEVQGLYDAGAK